MKIVLLFVFVALISACSNQPQPSDDHFFEVIGFEAGKMRESDGRWEIYQQGRDMRYEVNGACEYDGAAYPCMWYGWVINYRSSHDKLVLQCTANTLEKVDWGNAEETAAEQAMEFEFTLTFDGQQTEKRTPNYIIASSSDVTPDRTNFSCHYEGREVLSYTLTVMYEEESSYVDSGRASLPRWLWTLDEG